MKQERPSERTRGKAGRSPARGITRGLAPAPRRSKRSGGLGGAVLAIFSFRRPMLALTAGVVLIAAVLAVVQGGLIGRAARKTDAAAATLAAHAGFGLAQVHLSGYAHTRPEEIVAALGVKAGRSIFAIDLKAARSRLMALPWVADAEIRRRFPDDLSVRIVERVPFARWNGPNGLVVVERRGHVITGEHAERYGALPLLVGEGAPEHADGLIEAVAGHRAILHRVQAYQYQSGRRWNLLLWGGVVVKLPETGWDVQLRELDRLIVEEGILETNIREIDLRPPTAFFFVVRRDGTQQQERRSETGSAI